MIKKLLITAAALSLMSNVAFAAHHARHAHHVKHVSHKADLKQEQIVETPVESPVVIVPVAVPATVYVGGGLSVNNVNSSTGLVANIFAGIGKTLDDNQKYYLGGEVLAEGSPAYTSSSHWDRTTYGLGASIIPGLMLNKDTMAYGRVGVKLLHNIGTGNFHTGGQLGLGLQTNVAQNWDVRGEYSYTGYGIIKDFTKNGSNQLGLGLVYKFN